MYRPSKLWQSALILALLVPSPTMALSADDKRSVRYDTVFYDKTDVSFGSSCTGLGTDSLDGHILPAASGGTAEEAPIDASGAVTSGPDRGKKVAFSDNAKLGQEFRDYYITMRWRYRLWNWSGTSTNGPEKVDFYSRAPRVLVTNPRTGKSIIAVVMEAGPAPWTGIDTKPNNSPKQGWSNPQDGTPASYRGRVSGLAAKAMQALSVQARQFGGTPGQKGDDLVYAWAPDQKATPGPTQLAAAGPTGSNTCLSGGRFSWPVAKSPDTQISGCWNEQRPSNRHSGIDVAGPQGTPILAAADGTVELAHISRIGYGNVLVINHSNGFWTLYGHNSQMLVRPGDKVTAGQAVAKMGNTGNSTGPHLHFNIQTSGGEQPDAESGKTVNPLDHLPSDGRNLRGEQGTCIPGARGIQ